MVLSRDRTDVRHLANRRPRPAVSSGRFGEPSGSRCRLATTHEQPARGLAVAATRLADPAASVAGITSLPIADANRASQRALATITATTLRAALVDAFNVVAVVAAASANGRLSAAHAGTLRHWRPWRPDPRARNWQPSRHGGTRGGLTVARSGIVSLQLAMRTRRPRPAGSATCLTALLAWDRAQKAGFEEQFRLLCSRHREVGSIDSDSRLDSKGQSK